MNDADGERRHTRRHRQRCRRNRFRRGRTEAEFIPEPPPRVKMAIVGHPNVGKSTLVNALLGEERVIAFDQPGTTRDSILSTSVQKGRAYTLIDTAGVRNAAR